MARIVTGIFGGVIGSISFAIITDLFILEVRGRVMGFVQMSFAASQILGLPLGLYLANKLGWHSPFILIAGLSVVLGVVIIVKMKPVDAHLKLKSERNALQHLIKTVSNSTYLKAFGATVLLATGGFMLMPFGSAFGINNLGLTLDQLPMLYLVTGICSMIAGPFTGKLSDAIGKYKIFVIGSIIGIIMVLIYCNLGITPLWVVIVINVILFIAITARMIAASALMTAVPDPADRGAFMGINSSIQQIAGGIATMIAGMIVVQKSEHAPLEFYGLLGYVVVAAMVITIGMMYIIHRMVDKKTKHANN
jgi:predicted MFS family arabinose efflux permease